MELEQEIPAPRIDSNPLSAVAALSGEIISPLERLQVHQLDNPILEMNKIMLDCSWKSGAI